MKRRSFSLSLQQQYELASLKRGLQELGVHIMVVNQNDPQNTNPNGEDDEQELTDLLARIDEKLDTHGASIDALIQTLPVDVQASVRAQVNQQQGSQQQEHLTNLRHDVSAIQEAQQQHSQKIDALSSAMQLLQQTLNDYYTRLISGEPAIPPKKTATPGTPPTTPQKPGDMQQANSNGQNSNTPGSTPQSPDVSVNGDTRPYTLVRKRGGRVVKRWLQPEKNKQAV